MTEELTIPQRLRLHAKLGRSVDVSMSADMAMSIADMMDAEGATIEAVNRAAATRQDAITLLAIQRKKLRRVERQSQARLVCLLAFVVFEISRVAWVVFQ